jgi:hypothetical protein
MKWSESERDRAIRAYSENVMVVNRYREIAEVTALLVNRDIVQESIDQGLPLSAEQAERIERADAHLRSVSSLLSRRFPELWEDRGAPTSHWWWRQDTGRERGAHKIGATTKQSA